MNTWRARAAFALLLAAVWWLHAHATSGVPNTPIGAAFRYGVAALCDLALLIAAELILSGTVARLSEWLCAASVCANAFGWVAYLLYVPPWLYDMFMWLLSLAQCAVLFLVDNNGNIAWSSLVRRASLRRDQIRHGEANT